VKREIAPGHIGRLVKALKPAVAEARTHKGDLLDEAVRANVHNVVLELSASHPILQEAVKSHKLKIVGARYGLKDGRVEWIP
jgi:carbonic anhydrase